MVRFLFQISGIALILLLLNSFYYTLLFLAQQEAAPFCLPRCLGQDIENRITDYFFMDFVKKQEKCLVVEKKY
jgi:NADH:ubiquinone oxidoreductase subunit 4 (subunit M)